MGCWKNWSKVAKVEIYPYLPIRCWSWKWEINRQIGIFKAMEFILLSRKSKKEDRPLANSTTSRNYENIWLNLLPRSIEICLQDKFTEINLIRKIPTSLIRDIDITIFQPILSKRKKKNLTSQGRLTKTLCGCILFSRADQIIYRLT